MKIISKIKSAIKHNIAMSARKPAVVYKAKWNGTKWVSIS